MILYNYSIYIFCTQEAIMDNNKRAKCIAFQGLKGGIGKTTFTENSAVTCAVAGYKVLVIDQDPQGSSTEFFRVFDENNCELEKKDIVDMGLYNLYINSVDVKDYIKRTRYKKIDIIPNARNVLEDVSFDTVFDNDLRDKRDKLLAFYNNLEAIKDEYDYIFIDGQPSNGRMTDVLLAASDEVVCPIRVDIYNISPVYDIMVKVDYFNHYLDRNIIFRGYVFNQFGKSDEDLTFLYKENFDPAYYIDTPIRFSATIPAKSSVSATSFIEYMRYSNPAKDFIKFLIKGIKVIDKKHEKILNDNIEYKDFGLRKIEE